MFSSSDACFSRFLRKPLPDFPTTLGDVMFAMFAISFGQLAFCEGRCGVPRKVMPTQQLGYEGWKIWKTNLSLPPLPTLLDISKSAICAVSIHNFTGMMHPVRHRHR